MDYEGIELNSAVIDQADPNQRTAPTMLGHGHVLHRRTAYGLIVGVLVVGACIRDPDPSGERADLTLLASESTENADSLIHLLITRQRELFGLLLQTERQSLSAYLAVDFSWGEPSLARLAAAGPQSERSQEVTPAGYFAILAGFTPPPLNRMPAEYEVQWRPERHAAVLAGPVMNGAYLITLWRRTSDGWKAIRMMEIPAEYVAKVRRPRN